jgi:hypothetical protein
LSAEKNRTRFQVVADRFPSQTAASSRWTVASMVNTLHHFSKTAFLHV